MVLCKPENPTANATEGDYTHLDNFLRLSGMQKIVVFGGCSSRVLGGLLRKTAVLGAMSGSRAANLLIFLLLAAAAAIGVQKTTERSAAEPRYMTFEAQNFLLNKDT